MLSTDTKLKKIYIIFSLIYKSVDDLWHNEITYKKLYKTNFVVRLRTHGLVVKVLGRFSRGAGLKLFKFLFYLRNYSFNQKKEHKRKLNDIL